MGLSQIKLKPMQIEKETEEKFFKKTKTTKAMPRVIPVGGLDDGAAL
jgi:hypothetical protein